MPSIRARRFNAGQSQKVVGSSGPLMSVALASSSALPQLSAEAVMKFEVKGHGMLAIEGLTPAGLPALRLVQYHSPEFQVACHNGTGIMRVCLKDIDLRPSLTAETPANMDRAQLSRLGSSQG